MAAAGTIRIRRWARELLEALGKVMLALAVFGSVFFGFQWATLRHDAAVRAAMPLPDVTVQSACAIWFMGSSSMSRWTMLQRDMDPWSTHNRSIGGATLEEITHRFLNEKQPQPPQAIVFYAGENDLAFGVPVASVVKRFDAFMAAKRRRMGAVPVLFVSVKPSPSRWEQRPQQAAFNDAIAAMAERQPDVRFVDTVPKLMVDGRPGPYFGEDGLHLNETGYHLISGRIRAGLATALPDAVVRRCSPADAAR